MKNLLVLAVAFSFGASALAATPLKLQMKEIKSAFAVIASNLKSGGPANNTASIQAAEQLIQVFKASLNEVPKVLSSASESQKTEGLAEYQRLINEEIQNATALRDALTANDSATAQALMGKMTELKKEGHSKFNP